MRSVRGFTSVNEVRTRGIIIAAKVDNNKEKAHGRENRAAK
jgi:hypothetical protein